MYRDYHGDIHIPQTQLQCRGRPWKPQCGQHHQVLKETQMTNRKWWDADLRTRRLASLDTWGISHRFLLRPTQEATVTAGQGRKRWVKESEKGRRLETLVARLSSMSATLRMTSLGGRQRAISCRSRDVGFQRLGIYKRSSIVPCFHFTQAPQV